MSSKIEKWGYASNKKDYYKILSKCDVVLSTSTHEFFGVSVIEACLLGVYPLLPNRLVYPELYPRECLYSTNAQLIKKLKYICTRPKLFRMMRLKNAKSFVETLPSSSSNDSQKYKTDEFLARQIESHVYFNKFKWTSIKNKFISDCSFTLLL